LTRIVTVSDFRGYISYLEVIQSKLKSCKG